MKKKKLMKCSGISNQVNCSGIGQWLYVICIWKNGIDIKSCCKEKKNDIQKEDIE